jgi:hypothetical protein
LDDGGCGGLERRLRVRVGAERAALPLPPLQALVVLNIPSWGAGVDLWRNYTFLNTLRSTWAANDGYLDDRFCVKSYMLRISNKYGSVTALQQCPNQKTMSW